MQIKHRSMLTRKLATFFLVLTCWLAPVLRAGVPLDYYLPAGTDYDPKVPTPEQFLGWQVGDWHLRSELIASYLQAVAAAAPDRVKLEIAGYTYEHKPLIVLTISSPENLRNLEKIRTQHLALFDPTAAQADLAKMPVVVNQGYSIHGNEPSGVNAMVLYVYYLAAARGPEIEAQLRDAVILIEAQRNPDGGDRAAQWFNQHKSLSAPSADPDDREHKEAWPNGRYNHYLFDPNRDWLPLVHPEARVRAQLFHQWRPNLLTDHHEMSSASTFFFQPGVPTRNNPSSAQRVFELTRKVAAFHQRALDAHGVLYFSEQGYDDFYPGKGSTYPDLHGTVGILFEQASARGHAQENDNGVLTFAYAIRNQVFTSFSTLEAALAMRTELLSMQRDFAQDTAKVAAQDTVRAYVFGDDGDPARAWAFVDLLLRHHIEVRPLKTALKVDDQTFAPGHAWVALTDQIQYRLLHEIFVQRTKFEDNIFYDVSAWTLPLAFNLPYAELAKAPATGQVLATAPNFPSGELIGGHSDYAYLIDWSGYYAPRALRRLQQAGIMVKGLTDAPIDIVAANGASAQLAPGAVLVPVGIQSEKAEQIRELINTIVREDAVTVYGCSTGLTPSGVDFGSRSFVNLDLPKVALITGYGVDAQEIGAAWHVLDQRLGLAPTLLDLAQLSRANLARYNVIMFADGFYSDAVSDKTIAALKAWVREGGTLVLTGRATEWAAKKELAAIEFLEPKTDTDKKSGPVQRQPYGSGWDREALNLVSGAIFAASIDTTHPLGFGFNGDHLAFCRANRILLKPAKSPYETPAVYTADPLRSGYANEANQQLIANSAAVLALTSGKGVVVALPDDPNFRGFWYGGNRVFFNALFYGRAIQAIRSTSGGDAAESH
jgi:hypothetical protein